MRNPTTPTLASSSLSLWKETGEYDTQERVAGIACKGIHPTPPILCTLVYTFLSLGPSPLPLSRSGYLLARSLSLALAMLQDKYKRVGNPISWANPQLPHVGGRSFQVNTLGLAEDGRRHC